MDNNFSLSRQTNPGRATVNECSQNKMTKNRSSTFIDWTGTGREREGIHLGTYSPLPKTWNSPAKLGWTTTAKKSSNEQIG